ncbi:unnamed protein product [Dicrocoelium dendriticum]|nr:unnamed protein product [Dicrocoelium dendriticum]
MFYGTYADSGFNQKQNDSAFYFGLHEENEKIQRRLEFRQCSFCCRKRISRLRVLRLNAMKSRHRTTQISDVIAKTCKQLAALIICNR